MNPLLISGDVDSSLNFLYLLNKKGIHLGLERIGDLLNRLGSPQNTFSSIHVAGTNGKGSTCAVIASILESAGFRVGLYTSPHLLKFNERIQVNGVPISDEEISSFIEGSQSWIVELDCTFFEATTALALAYFREKKVDYAVLEVGMGGRFDATNVVTPVLSVITSIGKDHQEFLGKSLQKIAVEKAGITKQGASCIVSKQSPYLLSVIKPILEINGAEFCYAPNLCKIRRTKMTAREQTVNIRFNERSLIGVRFPLIGEHQIVNLQTALAAIVSLKNERLTTEVIRRGIEATHWAGRLQILSNEPLVFYDVGHNLHGIRRVVRTLKQLFPQKKIHTFIALGRTKNYRTLGKSLNSLGGTIYLSRIPSQDSVPVEDLKADLVRDVLGNRIVIGGTPRELLIEAVRQIRREEILLIVGSHYLAPLVLHFFKK
ncbi:MAG: bifunctional folylpolyglutamate synthase/dihydrofolate synthase [Candidatus Marinimicrobia bacterium CG08_land_8_20_14_0_20_45_22]|nr:MAG: bifunctional folylpolyglutamate synthase/dihydrofolate synthase [Candidatus Marinimicrobia bacterium CG08_land_8_20_14_0_20_45_22]